MLACQDFCGYQICCTHINLFSCLFTYMLVIFLIVFCLHSRIGSARVYACLVYLGDVHVYSWCVHVNLMVSVAARCVCFHNADRNIVFD